MLSIECTEQHTGARISGDYWDLDELVSAVYVVIGDENRYYDYHGARQRILNVCYNLRKAIQGEKNIELISNGVHREMLKRHNMIAPEKNVYFSVEILWPELIFTALALDDFIKLHNEMIDDSLWNIHIGIIRKFQGNVLDCLKYQLSDEHNTVISQLIQNRTLNYFRYATQYVDLLNLEYINLSIEERKEHLAAYAIRLMIEDEAYVILREEILATASVTKNEIHELPLSMKYPEHIDW